MGLFRLTPDPRHDAKTAFQIGENSPLLVPKVNCPLLGLRLVCGAFVHFAQICEKLKLFSWIPDDSPEVRIHLAVIALDLAKLEHSVLRGGRGAAHFFARGQPVMNRCVHRLRFHWRITSRSSSTSNSCTSHTLRGSSE